MQGGSVSQRKVQHEACRVRRQARRYAAAMQDAEMAPPSQTPDAADSRTRHRRPLSTCKTLARARLESALYLMTGRPRVRRAACLPSTSTLKHRKATARTRSRQQGALSACTA